MARLIDSSVLVALERRRLPLETLLPSFPEEPMALAAVTAAELLVGVYRAQTPDQRSRRGNFVERLPEEFPVFPFDLQAARVHARLSAELETQGQRIGAHDLLIATTALTNGYDVLTVNARDFSRVPGLIVQQPDW